MERVSIPNTDLKVSPICVGCWQFNGGEQSKDKTWDAQPEQVSRDIVDKAIELGINFFDTAEGYLNSEEVLGRLLQGRRKDVVVATKVGARLPKYTAADIEQSLETSLRRLQTDYIDLYQVHWPSFMSDFKECFDEIRRQQAKGRIRYYSVCNFGAQNIRDAFEVGAKPVANQISYSLLWRPVEYDILPLCKEKEMAVLPYSPLQQGLLSGKYLKLDDIPEGRRRTRLFNSKSTSLSVHGQDGAEKEMFEAISGIKSVCDRESVPMAGAALSWLIQKPEVTSVITGARTPDQVVKNVQTVTLKQNVIDELDKVTQPLKEKFGNNADLWAPQSRMG